MRKYRTPSSRVFVADGPNEIAEYWLNNCHGNIGRALTDSEFVGRVFRTRQEVVDAASGPSPAKEAELVRRYSRGIGAKLAAPKDRRRRRRFGELDGEVDCDRAMRGDADYLVTTSRVHVTAERVVTLLCNVGNCCNVSAEDMLWRAAAATAAVDLLESAGYRCEVWGYWHSERTYRRAPAAASALIPIKGARGALDVDGMVNTLSPWYFRSVVYPGLCWSEPDGTPYAGSTLNYPDEDVLRREGLFDAHRFPAVTSERQALAAAEWLLEQVENGVPA